MNTNEQGLFLTEADARAAVPGFKECARKAGIAEDFFLYQHPKSKAFGLYPVSIFIPKSYRIVERI